MKHIHSVIFPVFFLVFIQDAYSQGMVWSDPVAVATSAYGFSRPRVVTNGNGDPVFLWSHEGQNKVYFNRYSQGQMGMPIQINPAGTKFFGASWAGPELAAYGQDVYVVGKEQPENDFGVSFFHSSDGGQNFSEYGPVDWALGDDLSRFPDVAAGPDGAVWVAFMRFASDFSEPRYVVAKSTDYGQSFDEDVNASLGIIEGEACDCCAAQLALSGDKLAMIYRNNDQNIRTIWAGISEDGGNTFGMGYEVDETGSYFASCPATAPDGYWAGNRLISTFRAAPGGRERVFFSVFDLDSQKVVLHQYLTNSPEILLTQNHPRITGNQDTVLLIWEESYAGNLDIKYRLSTTGPEGLVTAEAKVLNLSTSGNQLRPDVHFANGKLHAVYQDVITNRVIYMTGEVEGVSEIAENGNRHPIRLYPNPASGLIQISTELQFERVIIYNQLGRLIQGNLMPSSNNNIDVSNFQQGIYFIKFVELQTGAIHSERIVIMN